VSERTIYVIGFVGNTTPRLLASKPYPHPSAPAPTDDVIDMSRKIDAVELRAPWDVGRSDGEPHGQVVEGSGLKRIWRRADANGSSWSIADIAVCI
jgi:hypothetical protein